MRLFVLAPAAETVDEAAVAFGGSAFGQIFELLQGFPLLRQFVSRRLAGLGFAVESLGDGGGSADFTQEHNFDLKITTVISDLQHVSGVHGAGRLRKLAIRVNPAKIAGAGG